MGFYSPTELKKKSKVKVDLDQMESKCHECGLSKRCSHPKLDFHGKGKKGILIVGEFSSAEDDMYGVPLSGDGGELLKKRLRMENVSLNRDCWRINAVRCLPPAGKVPTAKQIKQCGPHLERVIKTLKPKLILLAGTIAITSLLCKEFSNRSPERWRGYCIPDEKFKCNIVPIYNPEFISWKFEKDKNMQELFKRDIKRAVSFLNRPFLKRKNYESMVEVLTDYKSVVKLLKKVLKKKPTISYDYESSGLKPFRYGHKIASIGIAVSKTKAYAFPYEYRSHWTMKELKVIRKLWRKILANDEIRKICQNEKFEFVWSAIMFNERPKHAWDTMMAEHILDNRVASTGLKFQTYVNYGVRPYDKHVEKYLRSEEGTEFNTVEKIPLKELLLYNGLDCIFTMIRYKSQIVALSKRKGLLKAYNFFMRGNRVMADLQLNGINMDARYYKKTRKELTLKVAKIKKYLETGREARAFKKKYHRKIKITSNADLGKLFFEVLGQKKVYTAKGSYKTDKATLEAIKIPFTEKLLEMKKWEKARGTYLGQFEREIIKGVMYPFFDLSNPITYRGSSSKPSFQNLPKRNPEVSEKIRKGIVPDKKDDVLSEIDFAGAEVITSVTYHKDKNFYNYLMDKSTDMHRDQATDLFMLKPDDLHFDNMTKKEKKRAKDIRFYAKNMWTFAQFYGDWFASCAPLLWEAVVDAGLKLPSGVTVKKHLESKGIYELGEMEQGGPTEGSFLHHCSHVEDKLWNERFPEYTQWKKDIVSFYQENGYIENHFGFRFVGYMGKNQCTNFPIQSASFHLLVYTLIEVAKILKKKKMKTKLIGNIHDSIVANVPKREVFAYNKIVADVVATLHHKFKWLIVPMEVEHELSKTREDGGNFAEMTEYSIEEIERDWKEAA